LDKKVALCGLDYLAKFPKRTSFIIVQEFLLMIIKLFPVLMEISYLPPTKRYKGDTRTIAQAVEKVVKEAINEFTTKGKKKITLAYLADVPNGVSFIT